MEKEIRNIESLEKGLRDLIELKYEAARSGLPLEKIELITKRIELLREEIERIKGIGRCL